MAPVCFGISQKRSCVVNQSLLGRACFSSLSLPFARDSREHLKLLCDNIVCFWFGFHRLRLMAVNLSHSLETFSGYFGLHLCALNWIDYTLATRDGPKNCASKPQLDFAGLAQTVSQTNNSGFECDDESQNCSYVS